MDGAGLGPYSMLLLNNSLVCESVISASCMEAGREAECYAEAVLGSRAPAPSTAASLNLVAIVPASVVGECAVIMHEVLCVVNPVSSYPCHFPGPAQAPQSHICHPLASASVSMDVPRCLPISSYMEVEPWKGSSGVEHQWSTVLCLCVSTY